MLDKYKITKGKLIQIAIVVIIAVLLPLIILQVQRQQNIRSKASSPDVYNAFEVTDENGIRLELKDKNGVPTYETTSLDIKIKVSDLEKLIQEGQL